MSCQEENWNKYRRCVWLQGWVMKKMPFSSYLSISIGFGSFCIGHWAHITARGDTDDWAEPPRIVVQPFRNVAMWDVWAEASSDLACVSDSSAKLLTGGKACWMKCWLWLIPWYAAYHWCCLEFSKEMPRFPLWETLLELQHVSACCSSYPSWITVVSWNHDRNRWTDEPKITPKWICLCPGIGDPTAEVYVLLHCDSFLF